MFRSYCAAVDAAAEEFDANSDMLVHAKRSCLNRSLKYLTMTTKEAVELLDQTGHYEHESQTIDGSWSTYGFDDSPFQYLWCFRFVQKLTEPDFNCEEANTLIVPHAVLSEDFTFLQRLLRAIQIFADPRRVVRLLDLEFAGRPYVAMQLRATEEVWPGYDLDLLLFLAMYLYLSDEPHPFWDPTRPALLSASLLPGPEVVADPWRGRLEAAPMDCFYVHHDRRRNRMVNLLPEGLGELWLGEIYRQLYPDGLPQVGALAVIPIEEELAEGENARRPVYTGAEDLRYPYRPDFPDSPDF
ncbi:Oidioi.mRNA.OKI2018_I69.chr1.g51.t1.cds [Oikopleura dioica]|uniref:Oidioi.mRNA.OKI2018_I69.chr1.g51.t1.cds n=1 Tax=Oikopleura dioica TaxID=34765 RepID=A0ABN7SIM3_OIKDI|nr:Oidioi.mRNA.OKI2018_I69.chr1.g51.t1.cds [Oikopleura dioica]